MTVHRSSNDILRPETSESDHPPAAPWSVDEQRAVAALVRHYQSASIGSIPAVVGSVNEVSAIDTVIDAGLEGDAVTDEAAVEAGTPDAEPNLEWARLVARVGLSGA